MVQAAIVVGFGPLLSGMVVSSIGRVVVMGGVIRLCVMVDLVRTRVRGADVRVGMTRLVGGSNRITSFKDVMLVWLEVPDRVYFGHNLTETQHSNEQHRDGFQMDHCSSDCRGLVSAVP